MKLYFIVIYCINKFVLQKIH